MEKYMAEIKTIQLHEDVYNELVKHKNEKQTFNDVLRELLNMDKEELKPEDIDHYQGEIIVKSFHPGLEELQPLMEQLGEYEPDYDVEFYGKTINGVEHVNLWITTCLEMTVQAKTKEELCKKLKAIAQLLKGQATTIKTSAWGKPIEYNFEKDA